MLTRLVKILTSLRLTVLLLAFAILIVFCGTIAQVNEGLYDAQARWFRSFFIWWTASNGSFKIPFLPGGYLVGTLLLVNLVAAHLARFQLTWKKLGINLAHFGIILLLAGQLATDLLSHESLMSFAEGETRNYSVKQGQAELVFISDAGDHENTLSIPQSLLAQRGEIKLPKLPFTIRVRDYFVNSDVFTRESVTKAADQFTRALAVVQAEFSSPDLLVPLAEKALATPGRVEIWRTALRAVGETDVTDIVASAKRVAATPARGEKLCADLKQRFQAGMEARFKMSGGAMAYAAARVLAKQDCSLENLPSATTSGTGRDVILVPQVATKSMDAVNDPAAIIELTDAKGSLGSWLVHPNLNEQWLELDQQTWRVALRFERIYHPFSVTLLKTTHEVYRGTDVPKHFQSRVRIENPAKRESREVDIYMNNPLRYGGLTFYQYQMGRDQMDEARGTSALQVVRNPSWITPYVGCALVGVGLVIQFLMHLVGFIKKRRTT